MRSPTGALDALGNDPKLFSELCVARGARARRGHFARSHVVPAGPPLPRAVRGCWATVRAGEIHVGYQDDPGRVFMYRGGAWEEHAAELDIEGAAACNPIILG